MVGALVGVVPSRWDPRSRCPISSSPAAVSVRCDGPSVGEHWVQPAGDGPRRTARPRDLAARPARQDKAAESAARRRRGGGRHDWRRMRWGMAVPPGTGTLRIRAGSAWSGLPAASGSHRFGNAHSCAVGLAAASAGPTADEARIRGPLRSELTHGASPRRPVERSASANCGAHCQTSSIVQDKSGVWLSRTSPVISGRSNRTARAT